MRVLRLDLAYDGTDFKGWARQRGAVRTVEGVLLEAVERVVRAKVKLSVAGRTDAGVHARGEVVSFGAEAGGVPGGVAGGVTGTLAPGVVVWGGGGAPEGFDARFSAS